MDRKGSAVWQGTLREGKGTVSTETGTLSAAQYNFTSRFEQGTGTNPEELIGAAHAGCFSMAFSGQLAAAKFTAERIDTTATVTIERVDGAFTITKIHLDTLAKVPGVDQATFDKLAATAKAGCPVSKALSSVPISLTATLVP